MKRFISLLCIVCIMFVCGCGKESDRLNWNLTNDEVYQALLDYMTEGLNMTLSEWTHETTEHKRLAAIVAAKSILMVGAHFSEDTSSEDDNPEDVGKLAHVYYDMFEEYASEYPSVTIEDFILMEVEQPAA